MQTTIAFVLLFSVSLAADVTIYRHYDYLYGEPKNLEPVAVSRFPWMFSFHSDVFFIYIWLKNTSPIVTAINITCNSDDRTFEVKKLSYEFGRRKGEEYYYIGSSAFLNSTEIKIKLKLYTSNILCSSLVVAEAKAANITNETLKKKFPYYGTRLSYGCVLVVDLKNKCVGSPSKMNKPTENAGTDVETINPHNTFNSSTNLETTIHKNSAKETKEADRPSQNVVLIYVIPSVIGMCFIILVIYLIRVKKYCHRNSHAVETIELNTYSTANEVLYADLGYMHGDSQPPRRHQESTYARIIGVMKPVDGNGNNK